MKKTILLALWLWAATAGGHTLPISYLLLVPDADYLHLELTLNPFELNSFAGLEQDKEIRLGGDQTSSKPSGLSRQILDCLDVRVGGKRVQAEVAGIGADPDSHHLTVRAHFRVDARSAAIAVESKLTSVMGISHLTQVTCLRAGEEQLAQLTGPSAAVVFAPVQPKPDASPSKQPGPSTRKMNGPRAVLGSQQPPTRADVEIISTPPTQSSALRAEDGSRSGGAGITRSAAPTRQPPGFSVLLLAAVMVAFPCAGVAVAMLLTALFHRTKPNPDTFINHPPLPAPQPLACAHSFAGNAKPSRPYA